MLSSTPGIQGQEPATEPAVPILVSEIDNQTKSLFKALDQLENRLRKISKPTLTEAAQVPASPRPVETTLMQQMDWHRQDLVDAIALVETLLSRLEI